MKSVRFLCTVILALLVIGTAFAETAETPPFIGDGTVENPYQVATPEQLDAVRLYLDAHFVQTADIDLAGMDWNPIGNWNEDNDENISIFAGYYDGQGYKIKNMTISITDNRATAGLFGVVSGEVKNVHLVKCSITVDKSNMKYEYLENFNVEGEADWTSSTGTTRRMCSLGSIVGSLREGAVLSHCYADGNMSVTNIHDALVGGIVGSGDGTMLVSNVNITVDANRKAGTQGFAGSVSYVSCGGIVGSTRTVYSDLIHCVNNGSINISTMAGYSDIGGVCGSNGEIVGCINNGQVLVSISGKHRFADGAHCGGIVGDLAQVEKSINYGSLTVESKEQETLQVGGIFGHKHFSSYYAENCLNMARSITCAMNDTPRTGAYRIGGGNSRECYSVDYTLINGTIPYEYIGAEESNGASLTKAEALQFIEELQLQLPSFTYRDSDEDGLYDHWELNGVDYQDDGVIDVPIHLMGADPYVPDVFVEIDWMEKDTLFSTKSFAPDPAALKMVYQSYKDHGINLHLDAGPDSVDYVTGRKWGELSGGDVVAYDESFTYSSGNWGDWFPMIQQHFSTSRSGVFRHCIFVDDLYNSDNTVWGLALTPYSFFGVSQSGVPELVDQASTFMHELGHTLGLPEDSPLYKPNNLSVMNYVAVHYDGLKRTDGKRIVNYSEFNLPGLDENNLNELRGIDPYLETKGSNMTAVFRVRTLGIIHSRNLYSNGDVAGASIDYNDDGKYQIGIRFDLNGDGEYTIFAPSFDEWAALDYSRSQKETRGMVTSEFAAPEDVVVMADPPTEQLRKDGVLGQPGDVTMEQVVPSVLYANTQGQALTVKLKNLNPAAAQVTLTLKGDMLEGGTCHVDVTLAASDDGFTYATASVPVLGDLKAGSYPLTVKVDCQNGTVITENLDLVVEDIPVINMAIGCTKVIDDKNDPDTLDWKSSDDSIASVQDGVVVTKQAGTVTITVTNPEGDVRMWLVNVDKMKQWGDADGNGVVDAYDALLVLQYCAGWDVTLNTCNADANDDGVIGLSDALRILEYCAGGNLASAIRALRAMADDLSIDLLEIVKQPADQSVAVGKQAQFTVSATGEGLDYQWHINRNDGNGWCKLKGAISTTYVTFATEADNDGYQYKCVITDTYGNEVTTDVAFLHVLLELPVTGDVSAPGLWLALCAFSSLGISLMIKKRVSS